MLETRRKFDDSGKTIENAITESFWITGQQEIGRIIAGISEGCDTTSEEDEYQN